MRDNGPITSNEILLGNDQVLVSRTDTGGRITFVNQAFIEISGFDEETLLGAPHNIVRHPHMPKEAFADLWATVKAGRPWEGLVKNRTKSGDFYWVLANVTPLTEDGKVTGYISIRTKPGREDVAKAERTYKAIREGHASGVTLDDGALIAATAKGVGAWLRSLTGRHMLAVVALLLVAALVPTTMLLWPGSPAIAFSLLGAGVAVALLAGGAALRSAKREIAKLEADIVAIIRNPVAAHIALPGAREFKAASAQLRALRARIAFTEFERAESDRKLAQVRAHALREMADTIEREARDAVEKVASRTESMANEAKAMSGSASRVSENAQSVAAAAAQSLATAQTVAAATEEMTASVEEIVNQVTQASNLTRQAVTAGGEAQETILSLSEAVEKIGEVVDLISNIAAQTNLLALNATIEAARAGEAGKGFAVVANEVKSLSSQTARATDDITRQIGDIQAATERAVKAVGRIGSVIAEIDGISTSVASAMEQQSATTLEISRNVSETSASAQEVSARIDDVSRDAGATGTTASVVQEAAIGLDSAIAELRNAIVRVVRSATAETDR